MPKLRVLTLILLLLIGSSLSVSAQSTRSHDIHLEHSDVLEVVMAPGQDTTFVVGAVRFVTESGTITCDSAIWLKGKRIKLKGRVTVDDQLYRLTSDSADYNLITGEALALGSNVNLWSRPDSLFAVGKQAFYDRDHKFFYMENRPTLYLRYPDTASMIEVISDRLDYDGASHHAQAGGNVVITSKELNASSGCAVFHPDDNSVDLFEQPVLKRGKSTISGSFIGITSVGKVLSRIDVIDSAKGDFREPIDSAKGYFDQSNLIGKRIIFDFDHGLLSTITSYGQAYSWYYPSSRGGSEKNENSVSGDTIRFAVRDERLQDVTVIGGAIGTYLNSKTLLKDSLLQTKTDTIDYDARVISYNLSDSVISLREKSHVNSGTMGLTAHIIDFDTRTKIVKAYSADAPTVDSTHADTTFTARLQPNNIPVLLKDRSEELYGDYLEYSIDTQKGRVVQSKSKYETGFYYGESVFRANKRIFYVDNGRYTTCDADEPHFHFHSKHMKLIEGEKLIAKPVIFSVGRLPILALPYYVFSLKKGRHSGILPFRFGNFSRGERYIENVGYYWAASDYWDWQGSMGYVEKNSTLTFSSLVNYNQLYKFNGSLSAQVTRQTVYSSQYGLEDKGTRYVVVANHTHQISPSFWLQGSGQYQSDPRYFTDLSTNVADRLNRSVKSTLNFRKAFSKKFSLSGSLSHEDQLDNGTRTVLFPSLALSVPLIHPFGSGKLDESGISRPRWYNSLTVQYSDGFQHSWTRTSSTQPRVIDSTGTDTTFFPTIFSRREYARFSHGVTVNFPLTIARYFVLNPNANYNENLFKIFNTDLSQSAGINSGTGYRTYSASMGASLSTKLYGTVTPNILGLTGLRQVLSPAATYTFTPKTARHAREAAFAQTAQGATTKSQSISFSLGQLYQAKIKKGDDEAAYDLLSLSSSVGYDFEKDSLRWTSISTSYQSDILPGISINGDLTHSLYKEGSTEPHFLSPTLTSFSFNTSFRIAGSRFLFDEGQILKKGADSANQLTPAQIAAHAASASKPEPGSNGTQWSLAVQYSYSQSGIGSGFRKSSFLTWSMGFNLTSTTRISYSQSFNPGTGSTVYNSVSINKTIHCWSGYLTWVPYGSTRGWSFSLYCTAIPAIKIDNSQSVVSSAIGQFSR